MITLDFIARSSLILAVALAAGWPLRRQPASLRHWLLAGALAVAAAQPLLGALLPVLEMPAVHITITESLASLPPLVQAKPVDPAVSSTVVAPDAGMDWAAMIYRAWLAGAAVSGAMLLAGLAWLLSLGARATDATPQWYAEADAMRRRIGIRRPVRIAIAPHPALLVTWGAMAPMILLPAGAGHWPVERMRVVLAHEMAHMVRRDWLIQLLAEAARAINWFNPLFWIACNRLRRESELACDDIVLDLGIGGTSYASQLVALARTFSVHGRTWLPAPSIARPSTLERRVRAMLNPHVDRRPMSLARRIAIAALLLGIAMPIAAASQASGTPSGTVSDPQGKPLANASLRLVAVNGGQTFETNADVSGHFRFGTVPAGDYMLSVHHPGFSSGRHRLPLTGGAVTLALRAQVGTLTETVTVDPGMTKPEVTERPAYAPPSCTSTDEGGRISPPAKTKHVTPAYRPEWRASGLQGNILLQATISKEGRVGSLEVLSRVHPELEDEALRAVSQWEFSPTYLNCEAVEVRMFVTVAYKAGQ